MSEPSSVTRRLTAIMAGDVIGYGHLMERAESDTLARLKSRRSNILKPLLEKYSGRLVKLMGDGFLAEFPSAVNAILCGDELQERMTKANLQERDKDPIELRIGINVGDVIVEGSDLYGDGVNLASRLEGICEPGRVNISTSVYDQVRGKVALDFEDLGAQRLKNVSEAVRVYCIRARASESSQPRTLVSTSASADSRKPAIAVLPFANLGKDDSEGYFVDGIVEEIILELSRFQELLVIARNSSFAFRDQNLDIRSLAEKLKAQYIVTGSLKRADKRVRLGAQLIEAESGATLWAERYDRQFTDIFDLQEELARTIAITLSDRVKFTTVERARRRGTSNMSAYECYLRGRSFLNDYSHLTEVEQCAKQAIALDPAFSAAHALLAHSYSVQALTRDDFSFLDRALPHAQRAIELEPNNTFANIVMGLALRYGSRWREGMWYAARAIELNPNDTYAHMMHAIFLMFYDDPNKSIEEMEFVLRRDPYPLAWFWDVYTVALTAAGRYEDALAVLDRVTEQLFWTYYYRAICQYHLSRKEQAKLEARKALELYPGLTMATILRQEPFESPEIRNRVMTALRESGIPDE